MTPSIRPNDCRRGCCRGPGAAGAAAPPRDWLAATRPTEVVELWVEDAWWEASLVVVKADVAVVRRNTEPPQTLSVGHERLRPGWRWDSAAGWTAPCIAAMEE